MSHKLFLYIQFHLIINIEDFEIAYTYFLQDKPLPKYIARKHY